MVLYLVENSETEIHKIWMFLEQMAIHSFAMEDYTMDMDAGMLWIIFRPETIIIYFNVFVKIGDELWDYMILQPQYMRTYLSLFVF